MFHFKSWLMETPSNLALVTNSRGLPFRLLQKVKLYLKFSEK